jgi:hypothetical protein
VPLRRGVQDSLNRPAPITTLESPFHNVRKPSTREIVTMAFDMPLYMAPGAGLIIWILVYPIVSAGSAGFGRARRVVAYLQQVDWVHHRVLLSWYQQLRVLVRRGRRRTAMPANAPASMFAVREKFGGRAS